MHLAHFSKNAEQNLHNMVPLCQAAIDDDGGDNGDDDDGDGGDVVM